MIYSIGYQRVSIEALTNLVKDRRINVIVDVRSAPYSRRPDKYEFNRNRLQRRFPPARLPTYTWKGDILGGKYGAASEEGIEWLVEHETIYDILLLCMEDDPAKCHRHYDIARRLLAKGIDVIHLHQGAERPESQFDTKEEPHV